MKSFKSTNVSFVFPTLFHAEVNGQAINFVYAGLAGNYCFFQIWPKLLLLWSLSKTIVIITHIPSIRMSREYQNKLRTMNVSWSGKQYSGCFAMR